MRFAPGKRARAIRVLPERLVAGAKIGRVASAGSAISARPCRRFLFQDGHRERQEAEEGVDRGGHEPPRWRGFGGRRDEVREHGSEWSWTDGKRRSHILSKPADAAAPKTRGN